MGPNRVGFNCILQPFSDATKLLTKEQTFPLTSNYISNYFAPVFRLFLSLLIWMILPYLRGLYSSELGLFVFLRCTGLGQEWGVK